MIWISIIGQREQKEAEHERSWLLWSKINFTVSSELLDFRRFSGWIYEINSMFREQLILKNLIFITFLVFFLWCYNQWSSMFSLWKKSKRLTQEGRNFFSDTQPSYMKPEKIANFDVLLIYKGMRYLGKQSNYWIA